MKIGSINEEGERNGLYLPKERNIGGCARR
jgi:hypothetical protein